MMITVTRDEFEKIRASVVVSKSSDEFHGTMRKFSQALQFYATSRADFQESDRTIDINNKIFDYSIALGFDVYPGVCLNFTDCTFNQSLECTRLSALGLKRCTIKRLVLPNDTTQLHVLGGSIDEVVASRTVTNAWFVKVGITNFMIEAPLDKTFFDFCTFSGDLECRIPRGEGPIQTLHFTHCTFDCLPDFIGSQFSKSVNFYECKFLVLSITGAKYYRDLKQKMTDNHDDLNVALFAGLELKCKHTDLRPGIEYALSHGYKFLNDHGLDPFRPVKSLGLLALIASCTWGIAITWTNSGFTATDGVTPLNEFMQIVYLTFISILGPLRLFGAFNLLKISSFGMQLTLWFFTSVASLLWFFIILAVRRRFKVG